MSSRRKPYYIFIFSVLCCTLLHPAVQSQTQYGVNDTITVPAIIYKGDTLSYKELSEVHIYLKLTAAQKRALREWTRLRNAVYVTYPYAKKAGAVFNDIQAHLENIPDKEKRKDYVKSREKDLRNEFTKPLTDLSVYQGKVLMKLIARETGNTCYEIIHDYKGSFSASFWQSVAWIFGSSLKQTYNSRAEDAQIEDIVMEVRRMYGLY
ncbi:DUF4294 domain-containing protein [Agriterribacter sp.]|uniref:DUF4294 domain-containing protein n=1 Tax=Agriterribacter sp. TaxID=2821509 RepID=UPI002CA6D4BC|nr:DUF4294 domain-containing protein [Agriterribacter sp.]HRO45487.1 DUF4294 domain-containing protein [Agriterribacter sp.]HRQ19322.1 DUF4294 domain-containing protein [Agriterribacter sp.]